MAVHCIPVSGADAENLVPIARPAAAGDMPGVRAVAEHFGNLDQWPYRPDYLDRELETGGLWVGVSETEVVGFGGTFRRGNLTHLGDLFVLTEHQSSGIGRTVLAGLLAANEHLVTFASSDPRALALYTRQGMRPRCPLLYLQGTVAALPEPAVAAVPVAAESLVELDAEASGGRRRADLLWYGQQAGVSAYRTAAGYAFVRAVGGEIIIGPAGGVSAAGSVDAVLAALAYHRVEETARVSVFGPHPLLPLLLSAGFVITDMDVFLSSDPDVVPYDRYLPHNDLG
jgi:GNAT superfamily N-acetyltransferase